MTGRTEIIVTAQAEPRPGEMVCNEEQINILNVNGVTLKPETRTKYCGPEGFHGVHSRWLTPPNISSYDLAREALESLLPQLARLEELDPGYRPERVVSVIGGSSSPDSIYSGLANRIQHDLGILPLQAEARDNALACTSGVDGLLLLDRCLRCIAEDDGHSEPIYGFGVFAESIASTSNVPDHPNYLLWGNAAVILGVKFTPDVPRDRGIIRARNFSDGSKASWFEAAGIGTKPEYLGRKPNALMGEQGCHGKDVQRYIKQVVAPAVAEFVRKLGVDPAAENVHLCGHNPTYDAAIDFGIKAGFHPDRIHTVARERANTSSTSSLLNYHEAKKSGLIKSGDIVFLIGYGAGASVSIVYYIEP